MVLTDNLDKLHTTPMAKNESGKTFHLMCQMLSLGAKRKP
jgi:hypothetical protein